jgi:hypothetical protein
MIGRTFNPKLINGIVNDPSIRPHIGGDVMQPLDLTAFIDNQDNVALVGEHGALLWNWTAPNCFEVHTGILKEGRGAWAAAFAKAGVQWMREYGALHLWTRVLPDAVHVRRFTLKAGFKPAGQNALDWGQGPVIYDLFDWRAPCR